MRYYGAIPDPRDKRDLLVGAQEESKLPPKIDNSLELTPVHFQRDSDCVGQAVVAWAEMKMWAELGWAPELSVTAAYRRGQECDGFGGEYDGTTIRGALKAWKKYGLCPSSSWPYMGEELPTAEKASREFPLAEYRRIYGIHRTKRAIHEHGAVLAAFSTNGGWDNPVNGVIVEDGAASEGHAVLLCGWDDGIGFRIKNSWGLAWGDGPQPGLCYIPFWMFSRDLYDCWLPILHNGGFLQKLFRGLKS